MICSKQIANPVYRHKPLNLPRHTLRIRLPDTHYVFDSKLFGGRQYRGAVINKQGSLTVE